MTKLEKEIQKENQIIREHAEKLSELRKKEEIEITIPYLNKQVGKCFKYKNSYGGDSKSWWLCMRILGVESGFQFLIETFQEIKEDDKLYFLFRTENMSASFIKEKNYKPISEKEYKLARNAFFNKIGRD